jgi:hypothetical protein
VESTFSDFSQVNRFHYDPPPRQPRGGSEKLRNLDQYSSGEDFQVPVLYCSLGEEGFFPKVYS